MRPSARVHVATDGAARLSSLTYTARLLSRIGLGAPQLQTELTTSLAPFAEIRRRRAAAYGPFPETCDFEEEIAAVARSVRA